jgi:outer membrane protein TolC
MNLKNRGNKSLCAASDKLKRGSRVLMRRIIAACTLALAAGCAPVLWAQGSPLSLDDAVTRALEKDLGVQSANWDWLAATTRADAAKWRMIPGLSFSAGYQRLSDVPPMSLEMADPFYGFVAGAPAQINFAFPPSLDNVTTFALNMQYPVFAGFRIREAMAMVQLQSQSKLVGIEMVKRSLMF